MGRRRSSSGDTDLVLLSPRPHPVSLAPTLPEPSLLSPFLHGWRHRGLERVGVGEELLFSTASLAPLLS